MGSMTGANPAALITELQNGAELLNYSTTAEVNAALALKHDSLKAFGHGQSLQDKTAVRSLGVTYTNVDTKPICIIFVIGGGGTSTSARLYVDDGETSWFDDETMYYLSGFAVILPGQTYKVTSNTGSLIRFSEWA